MSKKPTPERTAAERITHHAINAACFAVCLWALAYCTAQTDKPRVVKVYETAALSKSNPTGKTR